MTTPAAAIDKIQILFDRHPCWMIRPLGQELQYSIVSVRRGRKKIPGGFRKRPKPGTVS